MAQAKEKAVQAKTTPKNAPLMHTVGRRKQATARVWFRRGSGKIVVNGFDVEKYFDTKENFLTASAPFRVLPISSNYDVQATVVGGGKHGQANAVKLAIARAIVGMDETIRPVLRKQGLLTVDARQKERKKYGQKGARKKFQFVKR